MANFSLLSVAVCDTFTCFFIPDYWLHHDIDNFPNAYSTFLIWNIFYVGLYFSSVFKLIVLRTINGTPFLKWCIFCRLSINPFVYTISDILLVWYKQIIFEWPNDEPQVSITIGIGQWLSARKTQLQCISNLSCTKPSRWWMTWRFFKYKANI